VAHLLGMGTRAHPQVDVRIRDIQCLKKRPGHAVIIMLARVDQKVFDPGIFICCPVMGVDGPDERGDFHEIGACAHNGDDFHN
jgi:hypothetical protein